MSDPLINCRFINCRFECEEGSIPFTRSTSPPLILTNYSFDLVVRILIFITDSLSSHCSL